MNKLANFFTEVSMAGGLIATAAFFVGSLPWYGLLSCAIAAGICFEIGYRLQSPLKKRKRT